MINFENKKVLFIDLDSTLIKTISGTTFPEDITDFRIQLPVLNKIVEKFPKLNYLFIVTNQGGIGKFITKSDFERKLDYVQHFTDNTDFELKDLAQKLVDNYSRDSLAYEVGQKLNCMANGNRYIA